MSEIEKIVRFQVLGPLRVRTEAGELAISAVRERAVLAVLLLHVGEPVSVERLIDAVWSDQPPRNARNQIQGCVSRLRKQLATAGADRQIITTKTHGYQLNVESERVDLLQFRRRHDEARAALADGDHEDARERFRSALSLWRGSVLGDVESPVVHRIAARLEEERTQGVHSRVGAGLRVCRGNRRVWLDQGCPGGGSFGGVHPGAVV